MITVLVYLLVFLAGGLIAELLRIGQERFRVWQVARLTVRQGGSPDLIARFWASRPQNWCTKPGCPRCWGRRWS